MTPSESSSPVPPPSESAERFALDFGDGAMAGWRWRKPGAPKLLFAHATGFCASGYKRMLAPLADAFDIIAPDLRGHGRTTLPADPRRLASWETYGRDLAAALDRLNGLEGAAGAGWILAGHSCGATSSALAARGRTDVAALILIEPVIPPLSVRLCATGPLRGLLARRLPLARGARARRNGWPDRAAVLESYARKPVFRAWAPGALGDYLEDGLVVDAGGGVRLACAPAWEAATFAALGFDFWGAIRRTLAPVFVLAAESGSTLFRGAAGRLVRSGASVQTCSSAGHFIPQERPLDAAAFIREAARAAGLG
ncbi:alpha/beta fold hydrolase [Amphiplicatus metriothermophilus]|uniref:Pimeloyl-ACP methyl ester carboxylesterase n=1 Tax=Amphiplicatus metriothermophilus TaxID=1519374 RepID=A0A239PIP3_9PROT|nr:alpha/beta hydrolase [Amphiplicatus metriothermophilus]MBB5518018.1 pimeloyl-ACP methyl ester carboxylesterase [Amphiplicatus metriothermophilus]SNT67648.1 Pimeloyl-ACP methyl ester carboxylesterase [Amphiplicatus metriothermophilus]